MSRETISEARDFAFSICKSDYDVWMLSKRECIKHVKARFWTISHLTEMNRTYRLVFDDHK